MTAMRTVTLHGLESPTELAPLLALDEWSDVSGLELSFETFAPVGPLVRLVERIPLRVVTLGCHEPLPPALTGALARCPLEALELESCALDGTIEALCAAPALGGLESLAVFWCPAMSRDAFAALSKATCRGALEALTLFDSGADDETLRCLFAEVWPRLRRLRISGAHASIPDPAMEALLAERGVALERLDTALAPRARALTRRERLEAVRALDLARPSRRLHDLWALLEGLDDDVYERELADELERALSAWSDDARARRLAQPGWGRPMARLVRTANVLGLADGWEHGLAGAPIDFVGRAVVDVHPGSTRLPVEPLARRLPRLHHVTLVCRANVLDRVELPVTVETIDAGLVASEWLGPGHGARELLSMLTRVAPGARAAWLGAQWSSDARFRGELDELKPDGWVRLRR